MGAKKCKMEDSYDGRDSTSPQSYLMGAPLEHEGLSPRALAYSRIWISCQLSDLLELLFKSPCLCRLSSRLDTRIMLLTATISTRVPGTDVLLVRVFVVTDMDLDGSDMDLDGSDCDSTLSDFDFSFFPKKPILSSISSCQCPG